MTLATQLPKTFKIEGGYSNNPGDPGGETNHGVTVAIARAAGYTGAMKDLTVQQATEILTDLFYIDPQFDKLALIDDKLADQMFDLGVNLGPQAAGKFIQRALNVLDQNGKYGASLNVDGVLGTMSRTRLTQFYADRGADGRTVLHGMVLAQASVSYITLAEATPSKEQFEFGWQLARVIGNA